MGVVVVMETFDNELHFMTSFGVDKSGFDRLLPSTPPAPVGGGGRTVRGIREPPSVDLDDPMGIDCGILNTLSSTKSEGVKTITGATLRGIREAGVVGSGVETRGPVEVAIVL
jgi:hypothetical protein